MTAAPWLAYRITGRALDLGIIAFAGGIMPIFLSPLAGALADRMDRRKLLIALQTVAMLHAAAFATLTLSGVINLQWIIALSFIGGVIVAFDPPVRQSFISLIVPNRADLPSAFAMSSVIMNASRLIAPPIAGFIIAGVTALRPNEYIGEGICIAINAASFVGISISLCFIRSAPSPHRPDKPHILADMLEGLRYLRDATPIKYALLLLAATSLTGLSYGVVLPVFVKKSLGGTSESLGLLMSCVGIGAIVGALIVGRLKTTRSLGLLVGAGPLLLGLSVAAISHVQSLPLAMAILLPAGMGHMLSIGGVNTFIQSLVDEQHRGRIVGMFTLAFLGVLPIGGLAIGWLAERFGVPAAMLTVGLCATVGAIVFLYRVRKHLPKIPATRNVEEKVQDNIP